MVFVNLSSNARKVYEKRVLRRIFGCRRYEVNKRMGRNS
jgi:hypothetical protein